MECNERIKDLLPDYYLGQLPDEEAEEVREHLAGHAGCREALEEVAQVLDLMPFAAQPAEPPPGLKERVMGRALAERPAAPVESPPEISSSEPADRWRERLRGPLLASVAAVVALVAIMGLFWAYLDLQRDNRQLRAEVQQLQGEVQARESLLAIAVQSTDRAPEARGTAVVDPADGALALDVYNLPEPPTGHSYRAWLVGEGGNTISLGSMEVGDRGDGRMTGEVSEPLDDYEALQITVEPTGAEDMSGPVYLEAQL